MTSVTDRNLDTSCYPEPDGSGVARTDGSEQPGDAPPNAPLPPKPDLSNMDDKAALESYKQARRRVREGRKRKVRDTLHGIHRTQWYALAGVGACVVGFLGVRSILGMQRDTALALASRADTASAVQPEAPTTPLVVDGIPNPLADLKLTGQARWIIGEVDGELPATRSATVLTALLEQVDLCSVFVGLNDRAGVEVNFDPTPGYSPLVQCDAAPATKVPDVLATTTTAAPAGQ